MLGDKPRVLSHCLADFAGNLVREILRAVATRHVRNVDAPAVHVKRGLEVAAHDRILARVHTLAKRGALVIELRERIDAEPAVVAIGVLCEKIEACFFTRRVSLRSCEPLVGIARVVCREVHDDLHAARMSGPGERNQGLVAAQ